MIDTLKYHHSAPPSLIRRVHYECSAESTTTAFGDFNARRGRLDVLYVYYNTDRVYSNLSHVGGRQQVFHITKHVQYKHLNV